VVMNINESHYSAIPCDKEGQGSRRVSGGPAQGGEVATTMETQCPVEDRLAYVGPGELIGYCDVAVWVVPFSSVAALLTSSAGRSGCRWPRPLAGLRRPCG